MDTLLAKGLLKCTLANSTKTLRKNWVNLNQLKKVFESENLFNINYKLYTKFLRENNLISFILISENLSGTKHN